MEALIQARARSTLTLLGLALLFLGACAFAFWVSRPPSAPISVTLLSSRPTHVSGGDLLVQIHSQDKIKPKELSVRVGGKRRRAKFRWTQDTPPRLLGLVSGVPRGKQTLKIRYKKRWSKGKASVAQLAIRNFPRQGPMISGPHETPYICETERFRDAHGETLGPPLNQHCAIKTKVQYVYLNLEGEFVPWPSSPPKRRPKDIANTPGKSPRPFIVRIETGSVNRAIYEIAMLHDPADPEPSPWQQSAGWNGKLIYTHGGGCRRGWYRQGTRTGGVLRQTLLEQGYALVSASLNVFGQNCNDLLASETHMMVKERFIERYGPPLWTMGTGGSGGSYQCHQTADNYPGIFDGILVSLSFPDALSSTIFTLADARLMHHYFSEVADPAWTDEAIEAATGFAKAASLPSLSRGAARIVALPLEDQERTLRGAEYDAQFPEKLRYSSTQKKGARATVYDHMVNVLGKSKKSGAAGRPLDNVGVQYGLLALQEGKITVDQFLDLNEKIGGFDEDGNIIQKRHRADPRASRQALATGRITRGQGGLLTTPTIDLRRYTDERVRGDVHMFVHQFSMRERLKHAGSDLGQYHMVIRDDIPAVSAQERKELSSAQREAKVNDRYREVFIPLFLGMDRWLTNIAKDTSKMSPAAKLRAHRPEALRDGCWTRDEQGQEHFVADEFQSENFKRPTSSSCLKTYPVYSTPRMVAGAPLANDIVKCRLVPPKRSDYPKAMSRAQWHRLRRIFPGGVCDFRAPGALATPYRGPWTSAFGKSQANGAKSAK